MWQQLKTELKNSKIYIYSVSITLSILSIFGIVIFFASMGNQDLSNLPSPNPTDYASVLGAQKQANAQQMMQQREDRWRAARA